MNSLLEIDAWTYKNEQVSRMNSLAAADGICSYYKIKSYFHDNLLETKTRLFMAFTTCDSILEVGAGEGTGGLGPLLSCFKPKKIVVGCDLSLLALKSLKKNLKVEAILCDAEFLPFKSGSFDLVIHSEVLEHLPDPVKAFSEMAFATNKYAIVTTPQRSFPRWIMDYLVPKKNAIPKNGSY